jgi:condensin subunit ScpB
MSYDVEQLQRILEGAILAAGEPLNLDRMISLFEEEEAPSKDELRAALEALRLSCEGRGFQLVEVASGFRFQVIEDLAEWVNRLWEEKPQKYSRAMLETLALIAYRQPITRGDIEEVRGVAVSSHIIKTLVERDWVKVVGHRDVPGRPALYATTRQFLDYFSLKSLEELPLLGELKDIDSLDGALNFENLPEEIQASIAVASQAAAAVTLTEGSEVQSSELGNEEADEEIGEDSVNDELADDDRESVADGVENADQMKAGDSMFADHDTTEQTTNETTRTENESTTEDLMNAESAAADDRDENEPSEDELTDAAEMAATEAPKTHD